MPPHDPPPLAGRRAAVTGASRGIGAATARMLAAEGAEVALLHHPAPDMAQLAVQVTADIAQGGGSAAAFAADLGDPAEIEAAFAAVARQLGPVGVLVNNAAVSHTGPWDELSVEDWDALVAVNLRAAWLCARAAVPGMRAAGWGRIVNVSSIEARTGSPEALAYVASKAALIGLTRSLARAVGPDWICVNTVMPGAIKTELEREAFGDSAEHDRGWIERQSVPRRGTPEDVAHTIAFLSSPASGFVTGQVIAVDGGATSG